LAISSAVWIQSTNVTDRQTDRQTDTGRQQRPRLRIASHVKNKSVRNALSKRWGFLTSNALTVLRLGLYMTLV